MGWLFALFFLALARVGENRFVKTGEHLRLFGLHHLAMIVTNVDSNIKDNVEPGYLARYRKPSSPTGHRGVDLLA
jgi:hypothetical protein